MQWKFMHTIVLIQDGCQLQEVMSLGCVHFTTYNGENIKLELVLINMSLGYSRNCMLTIFYNSQHYYTLQIILFAKYFCKQYLKSHLLNHKYSPALFLIIQFTSWRKYNSWLVHMKICQGIYVGFLHKFVGFYKEINH